MNRIYRIPWESGSLEAPNPFRIPHSAFRIEKKPAASSLVTTLLVLVVLSTIVVAFLQSMSVERNVARSARNKYQAQLAAEAGLEAVMRQLTLAAGTNQAYVVGQTNDAANFGPILVVAKKNLTNVSELMPLISGNLTTLNGYPTNTNNGPAVLSYLNARTNNLPSAGSCNLNLDNKLIEITSNSNCYRAPWVYLTDASGKTNARYAYIVLDEWARVNPRYHGVNTPRNNPTNWVSSPRELPLYTGGSNLLATNDAASLTNIVPALVSTHTMGQAFPTADEYQKKKHLLTANEIWSLDVIPADLPEGGKPKYNINDLATNTSYGTTEDRANKIADIINTNLPTFKTRDQSLSGTNQIKYLRRLGACIVDYIDSDSDITTVNGGEPAGRDIFPLVTAIANRLQLTTLITNAPASAVLDTQFFLQVWNPYTSPVTITNARVVIENQIEPTFGTAIKQPISTYDQTYATNVTIRPNEMVVLEYPNAASAWSATSPTSATGVSFSSSADTADGSWPYFNLYINGQLVDQNRRAPTDSINVSGLPYASKTMVDMNNHWECFFVPTYASGSTWRFVGDPRSNFLSNYNWAVVSSDSNYTNGTRWQGRQQNTSPRYQEFDTSWLNRDYVRVNPPSGNAPATVNTLPSSIFSSYNATTDAAGAVSCIRNAPMQSIGELGHIYDEAQVADDLTDPSTQLAGAGGGRTLRIGQPEFASANATVNWNTNGKRAIELLDLFTVNTTNGFSTNYPAVQGRINVNTAPQAVLEALFYNISPTSDLAYQSSVITNVSALAQSIITNRPFNKLSDLYKITPGLVNATNYAPALGTNLATNSVNPNPLASVFDRAREEAFGKMVGLCTVQSRSFRVFVVGQSLGPDLKRQGQAVIEASLQVQADAGGSLKTKIIYANEKN
ncbi:MAG: hypothetical protein D4R65_10475 [Verrucomicrobiaceae bacterium]|nr:MAG: hypothetical protein D4R65_10475 [Verrucomicrobiaceae bacterium]